jgi:hypothetical protein
MLVTTVNVLEVTDVHAGSSVPVTGLGWMFVLMLTSMYAFHTIYRYEQHSQSVKRECASAVQ